MASALRKFFRLTERHRSGERNGGWRRKNNNKPQDSPNHHNHQSAAMRFFGHCASPRSKRDTHKVSPEDGANSANPKQPPGTSSQKDEKASPIRKKSSKVSQDGPGPSTKHTQAVRTRRLMKEFQEVTKTSRSVDKPPFTVELVEDNLYEWNVKLFQIDPESDFYRDMVEADVHYVLLNMVFPENFPFSPPFMRVISPHVEKGFVMEGGAICMELLTPRGWASAYTIEAIVMQFAASLVRGQGRIARKNKSGKEFSKKSAEASFRSLVKTHDKYGWVTPPLADG